MRRVLRIGMLRAVIYVFIMFSPWAGTTWAGADNGSPAVHSGDYNAAYNELLARAERGQAEAQYEIARLNFLGLGVSEDRFAAREWLRKAAKQNHVQAQYRLGLSYYKGWGGTKDFTAAALWLQKAAEQGDLNSVGYMATMYRNGLGVSQNYVLAYANSSIIAERSNFKWRDIEERNLKILEKRMSTNQIDRAKKLARDWLRKHKRSMKEPLQSPKRRKWWK